MHSYSVTDDSGRPWTILHNGDFSGDVQIHVPTGKDVPKPYTATIPYTVLRKFVETQIARDIIYYIESEYT